MGGLDKFINVGWGSKSTQFHGSLGKSAAQDSLSTAQSVGSTSLSHPTDDGLPRITFRGDAAFFAVSSLDFYDESLSLAHRQIRIFSRDGPRLSASSESLPGLEAVLSWKPSGNLLSAGVRYGYAGGGDGKEGRWDIAMLERNGLRHGGFELRETHEVWKDGKIRGMSWSPDSEVLAIWIQRESVDVSKLIQPRFWPLVTFLVQLWSMKNYHYYLKQEIMPHGQRHQRFRGFIWHPEHDLRLHVLGDGELVMSASPWYR